MKINVKVGKIYARVEVGDVDKNTRLRIQKHIAACPECARMVFRRKSVSASAAIEDAA